MTKPLDRDTTIGASADGLRDRMWRSVEGAIDPFHDTEREVLPDDAWRFILYFANQARAPSSCS